MLNKKCVVLNSTYEYLDIVPSKRALLLCLQDKAQMLCDHDILIRSQKITFKLPSLITVKRYISRGYAHRKSAILTRQNLLLRDDYTCQYCGSTREDLKGQVLTKDHVIPKAKGGKDTWSNLVTACHSCNNKKGNFLLEDTDMSLLKKPYTPTVFELYAKTQISDTHWNNITRVLGY
ncbi:MAG: HNH endonuclease [Betaproteobacteria bacterium]|jgi:5-methylcytosine-specific restriction endonuclease McrA